jgi:hypothetical protein
MNSEIQLQPYDKNLVALIHLAQYIDAIVHHRQVSEETGFEQSCTNKVLVLLWKPFAEPPIVFDRSSPRMFSCTNLSSLRSDQQSLHHVNQYPLHGFSIQFFFQKFSGVTCFHIHHSSGSPWYSISPHITTFRTQVNNMVSYFNYVRLCSITNTLLPRSTSLFNTSSRIVYPGNANR